MLLLLVLRAGIPPHERTHLIEYGVLAAFVHAALTERARNGRRAPLPAIAAIMLTTAVGITDELWPQEERSRGEHSFADRQQVFQWHEDGIALPGDCAHLARSPDCDVQAFRHGEHVYGFQFHIEADANIIERWLTVGDNQAVLADEAGRVDPDAIRRAVPGNIGALEALSRATFGRWIDRFEIGPRRRALPSR